VLKYIVLHDNIKASGHEAQDISLNVAIVITLYLYKKITAMANITVQASVTRKIVPVKLRDICEYAKGRTIENKAFYGSQKTKLLTIERWNSECQT
jgi:hypothetical protein